MRPPRIHILGLSVLVPLVAVAPAAAHHEAIFGPQSALVLSPDTYLTAQTFTRQTGTPSDRTQETTTVVGGGFSPLQVPLSFSIVMPFSVVSAQGARGTRVGLEDAIVGIRYRVELPGVERALSLGVSYLLGVGGVEFPTGTLDHEFGEGSAGIVAAGLFGIERGPFSAIGYSFFHRHGVYKGVRESGNVFVGGGAAWTPVDDTQSGRLFSLQIGLSRETTFREEVEGVPITESGGWGVLVHPTIMWGASEHLMIFGMTSLPVAQEWHEVAERERFRIGAGLIVMFGH
jgi:hypothetical protein